MLQYQMWQEINLLAKKLYLASPMKTLVIPKYRHSDGTNSKVISDSCVIRLLVHLTYMLFITF
uniref:Uncharacterized protein n=1 Tax=Ursus americanus TaxID=9643 RepID=A0A452QIV7_URSAM